MDRFNKLFAWRTWNDRFALFLMAAIIGMWVFNRVIQLPEQVQGALIVVFTLIAQYYFRTKPPPDAPKPPVTPT